jgi:mannose-6-phosphate isomerase-like protein (cupin superfamily)
MRKIFVGVFAGLLVLAAADTKPVATIVGNQDIQATIKGAPKDSVQDQSLRVVDAGKMNIGVGVTIRSSKAAEIAEEHDSVTEVYHILEGSATLMTGGDLVNQQGAISTMRDPEGPSGPGMRGQTLRGGDSRRVVAGDVVIIPAGVGHHFSKIDGTIKYLVVRLDPDKTLPMK